MFTVSAEGIISELCPVVCMLSLMLECCFGIFLITGIGQQFIDSTLS